jgi:hypothetical protein
MRSFAGEYASAFSKMSMLMEDVRFIRVVSSEVKGLDKLLIRTSVFLGRDAPSPNPKLIREFEDQVNAQLTIDSLWIPVENPNGNS